MPVIPVADPADPRLCHYTRLTDMQLRMVTEPAQGVFLAEGEKVIRRALAAGLDMVSALMAPKWWPALAADVPAAVPVFLGSPELLESITGFRLHRGALATFRRPVAPDAAQLLTGARTAILLEDLVDHTNVGAVFRSAAGLGVDALLVTERCADPWYRRSIKTSMGAVFTLPWTTVPDAPSAVALARRAGMTSVALDPAAGSSLRDWRGPAAVLLLLGTEGVGLSDAARACVDRSFSIPMHHGVDSLNVAAAAAIACFVFAGDVEDRPG
ncbi:MAG TPA: RNA methyltransferase [Actinomycetota bacterium]|nr:RNA methyltransferase [Actinomycetota bacterium]